MLDDSEWGQHPPSLKLPAVTEFVAAIVEHTENRYRLALIKESPPATECVVPSHPNAFDLRPRAYIFSVTRQNQADVSNYSCNRYGRRRHTRGGSR